MEISGSFWAYPSLWNANHFAKMSPYKSNESCERISHKGHSSEEGEASTMLINLRIRKIYPPVIKPCSWGLHRYMPKPGNLHRIRAPVKYRHKISIKNQVRIFGTYFWIGLDMVPNVGNTLFPAWNWG